LGVGRDMVLPEGDFGQPAAEDDHFEIEHINGVAEDIAHDPKTLFDEARFSHEVDTSDINSEQDSSRVPTYILSPQLSS